MTRRAFLKRVLCHDAPWVSLKVVGWLHEPATYPWWQSQASVEPQP